MDNFVSVILKTRELDENAIVEAMLDALDAPLAERTNEYGLFESENESVVVRLQTPYELDEEESDAFAQAFADRMFEMGYDDFEIETSINEAKTLKRGSKGPEVKKLQYDLGVQPADGDFGPATEKAVKDFQKRYKLTVDGIVGPNTAKQIARSSSISTKDEPEYHKSVKGSDFGALSAFSVSRRGGLMNNPKQVDAIKELQKELKRRGWYEGEIDGKYGPQTKMAVKSFQSKKNLYTDGDAGPKTINALMQRDSDIQVKGLDDVEPSNMPDESDPAQDAGGNSMFATDKPDQEDKGYAYVIPAPEGAGYSVILPGGQVWRELNNGMGRTSTEKKAQDAADRINKQQGLDPDEIDAEKIATDTKSALGIDDDKVKKYQGLSLFTNQKQAKAELNDNTTEENEKLVRKYAKIYLDKETSAKDKSKLALAMIQIVEFDDDIKVSDKTMDQLKKAVETNISKKTEESAYGMFEETYDDDDEFHEAYGWIGLPDDELWEAEYRGRKVKLNKPMRGDVKKFKVYVKNPKGNVVKVNFGDPNSKIKKSNPARRRSFRARHNCDNPGPKTKARYWSCRKW